MEVWALGADLDFYIYLKKTGIRIPGRIEHGLVKPVIPHAFLVWGGFLTSCTLRPPGFVLDSGGGGLKVSFSRGIPAPQVGRWGFL